jgi:beta-glucosidase
MRDFPDDFLWGSSTAAHQVEGGNSGSDWWEWEHASGTLAAEPSGIGIDQFTRYDDDFALLASLGHQAHRLSLEWARVEPSRGVVDEAALDHYERVLTSLHRHGITPFVTLHHKTLPRWFSDSGGWLAPDALDLFGSYVATVAARLGPLMPYTCTINEPQMIALFGYLIGQSPPNVSSAASASQVNAVLMRAHRRAVAVMREHAPSSLVGVCQQLIPMTALRPTDAELTAYLQRLVVDDHLDDLASGGDVGDWVGLQYYTRIRVDGSAPGFLAPAAEGSESTQMGWEVHPQGFGEMLRQLSRVGLPIVVTENGIATADDDQRLRYLRSHLDELSTALREGVDVRGYLHWSAFDNFEWNHGYAPTFGLVGIDRSDGLRRIPRPSAYAYRELIRTGRLDALTTVQELAG